MTRIEIAEILRNYIPADAAPLTADLLINAKVHLTITRTRHSKFGDYRHPFGEKGHRITVNHNLNPYAFLITLLHEIAHLYVWEKHKNKVSPHGREWKQEFQVLLSEFYHLKIFPETLNIALKNYMLNPGASSCSDPGLMRALNTFDRNQGLVSVENLREGSLFKIPRGMVLQKGPKRRTRYKCRDLGSGRFYLVSGHMMVTEVEKGAQAE